MTFKEHWLRQKMETYPDTYEGCRMSAQAFTESELLALQCAAVGKLGKADTGADMWLASREDMATFGDSRAVIAHRDHDGLLRAVTYANEAKALAAWDRVSQ